MDAVSESDPPGLSDLVVEASDSERARFDSLDVNDRTSIASSTSWW